MTWAARPAPPVPRPTKKVYLPERSSGRRGPGQGGLGGVGRYMNVCWRPLLTKVKSRAVEPRPANVIVDVVVDNLGHMVLC